MNPASLTADVRNCRRCPLMAPGTAVLGPRNGTIGSAVLFVGEAPGRLGAGSTGVPFSGDAAGARFERLLAIAGLTREAAFVTNATLCLPLDARGRNRRPLTSEVAACNSWLARTIALTEPALVVPLGIVALSALGRIEAHGLTLRRDVGTAVLWRGARLLALYHPAARSQVHRPWPLQVQDWRALGAVVRSSEDNPKNVDEISPARG